MFTVVQLNLVAEELKSLDKINTFEMNTTDDVTLVVEGHKIECSKKKLAQHSEYFKIMFEGNFSERDQNTITMNDVDFESLRICIEMLENKSFIPETENLLMVVETACMLQFEELTEIIGQQLLNNLDVDNCLDVWFFTERLNLRPVYLKAKRMALVEFNTIKDRDALLKLDKEDLHKYLANVHLVCKEFDVFRAFMSWHSMNGNSMIEVLAFLDFNRLTDKSITDMLKYPNLRNSWALFDVLTNVIRLRNGRYAENDLAQKLLNCNRRGCWTDPLFFEAEADEQHTVADDDGQWFWEALKLWTCQEKFESQYDYNIIGHDHQIYLIRSMYVAEELMYSIWLYDSVQKRWFPDEPGNLKHDIFDSCNNVLIPFWGGVLKCCNYIDKQFLFYNGAHCAYLYDHENHSLILLNIAVKNFPKMEGKFAVYSCNDRIFLKDKTRLVQLRIEEDDLHVEKSTALSEGEPYEVRDKSLLCHDTEYNIRWNNNLVTLEGEMICRDQDDYRIGKAGYVFDTHCNMLLPDDHMVSGKDKYVNTIENLFAK